MTHLLQVPCFLCKFLVRLWTWCFPSTIPIVSESPRFLDVGRRACSYVLTGFHVAGKEYRAGSWTRNEYKTLRSRSPWPQSRALHFTRLLKLGGANGFLRILLKAPCKFSRSGVGSENLHFSKSFCFSSRPRLLPTGESTSSRDPGNLPTLSPHHSLLTVLGVSGTPEFPV